MKMRVTVVYRRGKRVCSLTYVGVIESAFCAGFNITVHPKFQAIAWNDVVSVTIQPEIIP